MSEPVAEHFDLNSLSDLTDLQESGSEIKIFHPATSEPIGITMLVAGPDSKRQKAATSLIVAERAELRLRKITGARLEDEAIRIAAASIIGWTGVFENGKEVEYSPSVALGLLTRYPFMREQIAAFSGDRANFLKK